MTTAARLHSIVEGPEVAPVLVLSNSLGTTLELWSSVMDDLLRHFRVVRYDTRGHGRSSIPPGPYELADLGRDLVALLDQLGIARAHLAGLSLGATTSLWVAANYPDRVASVAAFSAAARIPSRKIYLERAQRVRAEGTAAVAALVVGRWLTPGFIQRNPDTVAWLQKMITSQPADGYASCCEAVAGTDLSGMLDRIAAPTLCVAAAKDPAVPVSEIEATCSQIRNSRYALVPGVAHLQNVEKPREIASLIIEHVLGAEAEAAGRAGVSGGKDRA